MSGEALCCRPSQVFTCFSSSPQSSWWLLEGQSHGEPGLFGVWNGRARQTWGCFKAQSFSFCALSRSWEAGQVRLFNGRGEGVSGSGSRSSSPSSGLNPAPRAGGAAWAGTSQPWAEESDGLPEAGECSRGLELPRAGNFWNCEVPKCCMMDEMHPRLSPMPLQHCQGAPKHTGQGECCAWEWLRLSGQLQRAPFPWMGKMRLASLTRSPAKFSPDAPSAGEFLLVLQKKLRVKLWCYSRISLSPSGALELLPGAASLPQMVRRRLCLPAGRS